MVGGGRGGGGAWGGLGRVEAFVLSRFPRSMIIYQLNDDLC